MKEKDLSLIEALAIIIKAELSFYNSQCKNGFEITPEEVINKLKQSKISNGKF